MRIKFKKKEEATIPTASMSDIAFLLLIFFMVTTVFRAETGLKIELPEAEAARKIPTKNLSHIWVGENGLISIDDALIPVQRVSYIMIRKHQINPDIIVSIRADKNTDYGILEDIFNKLQEADVLKVSLATEKKRG